MLNNLQWFTSEILPSLPWDFIILGILILGSLYLIHVTEYRTGGNDNAESK